MPDRLFAVITGGGTAGHVLPALAVAEALEARGRDRAELHYVGAKRGIETRLVPPTGLAHTFLDVVGVQRRWDASAWRTNLAFLPKQFTAYRQASRLLSETHPRVVVSVGGYASLPAVLAARRWNIPVVVVSYDRRPGRASALASRFAAACAVAFADSPLPRATVTGAPVRASVLGVDRSRDRLAARARLGIPPNRFVVAVTGGSQGSGVLNAAVRAWVEAHANDATLAVRHVVGERFLEGAAAPIDGADGILYQVIGYEEHMADVYAASDLLVGRGGASTVSEVAVTGVPAVLVPWAGAADDHQTGNVRWLSDQGAAVLLPEAELARLGEVLDGLRTDDARRASIGEAAAALGTVHRSGALADLVEAVAA
jgi:undecaprenyldiphospho-muramoylpentapeptide beta-N-acetylglucosaminyltransferase